MDIFVSYSFPTLEGGFQQVVWCAGNISGASKHNLPSSLEDENPRERVAQIYLRAITFQLTFV